MIFPLRRAPSMDPIVVALAEDTLGTASSGDGVVFWRWLAVQLFPDWSGRLAGSSVWLRPSARSCRSLPFLRPRFLPSRHVLRLFLSFTLSLSLSLFLSFFLSFSLSLSPLSLLSQSRHRQPTQHLGTGSRFETHHATCTSRSPSNEEETREDFI